MNAFHVLGSITAAWAVAVALFGIMRENFPGAAEKAVGALSVVLVAATISAGILTSESEPAEHGGAGEATHSESQ